MTRITFSNYGTLEQMFIEENEKDSIETFWALFGSMDVPRNTGGIKIIAIGQALDTSDRGGWVVGASVKPSELAQVA